MDLIRLSIQRPVAVIAAVLMTVMFGYLALTTIPIQLAPDVNKPVIEIETIWFGAAPAEVEREVINRQEEVLRGLEGLDEMISSSQPGRGEITLTFNIGTNMDRALLLTANRLDRVTGYPVEVDEPTLSTASANDTPIAWFVLTRAPGNDTPIETFGEFAEDFIEERFERVPGVANSNVFGGAERELQVVVDADSLARYRLTVPEVLQALREANISVSAGDVDEGKRSYVVRTEGEFTTAEQVLDVLVRRVVDPVTGAVGRVTVADIAQVDFGFKEPTARIRYLGQEAIAVNAQRETGANVIAVMDGLRLALAELNADLIPSAGLEFRQVYDETIYINSAIDLVQQNIIIGGLLAAGMLMVFLRSGRATLVVSLAIPVSVIGSFVAMAVLGRSLNVVSMAGIAFAVGMVVDAAIVVLENIFRLRQQGKSASEAAYLGAKQVWGAVLVSALTTVVVFVPLLLLELEVGQLFRDIAVAISVSVVLSLIVAVTVIPALANRLLDTQTVGSSARWMRLPGSDAFARQFVRAIDGFVGWVTRSTAAALGLVVAMSATAVAAVVLLTPDLEYLPDGNRNFVFGVLIPPPGYNLDTATDIAQTLEGEIDHLWLPQEVTAERVKARIAEENRTWWQWVTGQGPDLDQELLSHPSAHESGVPNIEHFFFVSRDASTFVGLRSADPTRAADLIPVVRDPVFREPGMFGFLRQVSIFGRGIGGSRSINLDVSGGDLEQVLGVALRATGMIAGMFPRQEGNQFRPLPGLELGAPEVRVTPDRLRLADSGVTATDLGITVDTFNDGLRVAEITVDGKRLDLTLKGPFDGAERTQQIASLPVVTPSGTIVPVESLAQVDVTAGPTEIRHLERVRTVTLEIVPRADIPLETALNRVQDEIITTLEEQGLPPGIRLSVSGVADQLTETRDAMGWQLLMALVSVYLVMAVLFENFWYPLIIMISVPVAAAGGVAGLAILNLFTIQQLDMLTLLGFVILIGIVVNNAILLVHQSLFHRREEGMEIHAAIREATNNRIRPIFMSTLTSIFGMFPLVVFPGAGSELYRGLGSVVLGGLSLSAILTLLMIPALLAVFMGLIERRRPTKAAQPSETDPVGGPAPAE